MNIKIGLIGCGYWGKNIARNLFELGNLDSICDDNIEVAKKIASQCDVPLTTLNEMFNRNIDAVAIAAPAVYHYELAKKALLAHKHVFVEKPLSLTLEHAKELCDLAKKQSKILMVGHLLQYHSAFTKIKEIISNGEIGKLQYIYSNRLNFGKIRREENILWSFAPHDISMILSLTGELPQSVYCTGTAHLSQDIYDVTTTHLTFNHGIKAHIHVSWLHPFKEQKLVIIGQDGMIVFDDSLDWSEKVKYYPHQVQWVNGVPQAQKADYKAIDIASSEPLKTECQHFIDCIKDNQKPITDGEEGLGVLKVLSAAQKSLNSDQSIELSSSHTSYDHHSTCHIDNNCHIGQGTKIWHFSHILNNTRIGKQCTIGQNASIGPDVTIGDQCKIQNNVSIYKGVTLENKVFCGPSCVFTNVNNPRSHIERKDSFDKTLVKTGATIGANATIVCGTTLGSYSFIGAGAVVTKDVKPHALMVGNPAKQIGWVSHAGEKLGVDLTCPRENRQYRLNKDDQLEEIIEHAYS